MGTLLALPTSEKNYFAQFRATTAAAASFSSSPSSPIASVELDPVEEMERLEAESAQGVSPEQQEAPGRSGTTNRSPALPGQTQSTPTIPLEETDANDTPVPPLPIPTTPLPKETAVREEDGALSLPSLPPDPDLTTPPSSSSALPKSMPRSAAEVRAYMVTHSVEGNKMSVVRQPFVGETTAVPSILDPQVLFNLRRVGSKDVMNHRNANSSVRYIQRDAEGDLISERDYPIGSMHVDTVALCLDSWNIADPNERAVKIDKDSILAYLAPEEIDDLYEKCLEINPILSPNGGKDAQKKG